MPPELRRRGQPAPQHQLSDSEDADDFEEELSGDQIPDDDDVLVDDGEDFEEEDEELGELEGEEEEDVPGKNRQQAPEFFSLSSFPVLTQAFFPFKIYVPIHLVPFLHTFPSPYPSLQVPIH